MDGEGRPPLPSVSYWPSYTLLAQISFSPQPSAVIKIKDGSYGFHRESTSHSLVKLGLLCTQETLICTSLAHSLTSTLCPSGFLTQLWSFSFYRKFVRRWFEQKTHWSLQLKVTCDDLPCRWFFCWFLKATYTLHQKAFYNETKQRLRWRLLEKAINFFVDFFFTSVLFVCFVRLFVFVCALS